MSKEEQWSLVTPQELADLLMCGPSEKRLVIIDSRSFLEYNTCHIATAINVSSSKMIKRQLQNNQLPVRHLLASSHGQLNFDLDYDVIVYDQCTSRPNLLSSDCFLFVFMEKLVSEFGSVRFLIGGLIDFQTSFHGLCEMEKSSSSLSFPSSSSSSSLSSSFLPSSSSPSSSSTCRQKCLLSLSQPCMGSTGLGPTRILPFLFLGSQQDALSQEVMKQNGISYVLNVSISGEEPDFLGEGHFLRIPVNDSHRDSLLPHFASAFQFIDKVREANGCVLVHCLAGISRSPTLAIAYLMKELALTCDEAYKYVKDKRPTISPNFNFLGQLLDYEKRLKHVVDGGRGSLVGSSSPSCDRLKVEVVSDVDVKMRSTFEAVAIANRRTEFSVQNYDSNCRSAQRAKRSFTLSIQSDSSTKMVGPRTELVEKLVAAKTVSPVHDEISLSTSVPSTTISSRSLPLRPSSLLQSPTSALSKLSFSLIQQLKPSPILEVPSPEEVCRIQKDNCIQQHPKDLQLHSCSSSQPSNDVESSHNALIKQETRQDRKRPVKGPPDELNSVSDSVEMEEQKALYESKTNLQSSCRPPPSFRHQKQQSCLPRGRPPDPSCLRQLPNHRRNSSFAYHHHHQQQRFRNYHQRHYRRPPRVPFGFQTEFHQRQSSYSLDPFYGFCHLPGNPSYDPFPCIFRGHNSPSISQSIPYYPHPPPCVYFQQQFHPRQSGLPFYDPNSQPRYHFRRPFGSNPPDHQYRKKFFSGYRQHSFSDCGYCFQPAECFSPFSGNFVYKKDSTGPSGSNFFNCTPVNNFVYQTQTGPSGSPDTRNSQSLSTTTQNFSHNSNLQSTSSFAKDSRQASSSGRGRAFTDPALNPTEKELRHPNDETSSALGPEEDIGDFLSCESNSKPDVAGGIKSLGELEPVGVVLESGKDIETSSDSVPTSKFDAGRTFVHDTAPGPRIENDNFPVSARLPPRSRPTSIALQNIKLKPNLNLNFLDSSSASFDVSEPAAAPGPADVLPHSTDRDDDLETKFETEKTEGFSFKNENYNTKSHHHYGSILRKGEREVHSLTDENESWLPLMFSLDSAKQSSDINSLTDSLAAQEAAVSASSSSSSTSSSASDYSRKSRSLEDIMNSPKILQDSSNRGSRDKCPLVRSAVLHKKSVCQLFLESAYHSSSSSLVAEGHADSSSTSKIGFKLPETLPGGGACAGRRWQPISKDRPKMSATEEGKNSFHGSMEIIKVS